MLVSGWFKWMTTVYLFGVVTLESVAHGAATRSRLSDVPRLMLKATAGAVERRVVLEHHAVTQVDGERLVAVAVLVARREIRREGRARGAGGVEQRAVDLEAVAAPGWPQRRDRVERARPTRGDRDGPPVLRCALATAAAPEVDGIPSDSLPELHRDQHGVPAKSPAIVVE